MNRRRFLQISLAVATGLAGCTGGGGSSTAGPVEPVPQVVPLTTLFPGVEDAADLTAVGELPPTEIPRPERFFGTDPVSEPRATIVPSSFLDTFEHVVVLQLENRSLDNLLGFLYNDNPAFNGVSGKSLSNPIPAYAPDSDRGSVPVSKAANLQNPIADPAEQWTAVNVALYNEFNPPANQFAKTEADFVAPFNVPDQGAFFPPPLTGFVTAFYWRLLSLGHSATYDDYSTVMQCLHPTLVPVVSQLAQLYSTCDNWFCGVPSQTICNRAMFNAGSSAGFLINSPYSNWVFKNTATTIFNAMSAANKTWSVYYDGLDIFPLTQLIHFPRLVLELDHFHDMTTFYDTVESGQLPQYSLVQPRFGIRTNSYHPDYSPPATMRGEVLVNDIYQAIRNSNSATGSNFLNTLLVITMDEGGTCYDHVPPPPCAAPGDGYTPEFGFDFQRLGQRIPTVLISPWLPQGSVVSTQLDACTLIKTLEQKFGLSNLTQRDGASTSLANIPFLTTPRTRAEMPRLRVRRLGEADLASDGNQPIGGLFAALVGMVHAASGDVGAFPESVVTIQDGIDYLQQQKPKLLPG